MARLGVGELRSRDSPAIQLLQVWIHGSPLLSDVVDERLSDAAALYDSTWLRKDRPSVGLHPLLWWLPVVFYAIEDGLDATGPVLLSVPLSSTVRLHPGESAADVECTWLHLLGACVGIRRLSWS